MESFNHIHGFEHVHGKSWDQTTYDIFHIKIVRRRPYASHYSSSPRLSKRISNEAEPSSGSKTCSSFPRLWLDLFRTKVRIAPELGYNDNPHTIFQRVLTSQTLEPW